MSKKVENQKPFDVVRNEGIFNRIYHNCGGNEDVLKKILGKGYDEEFQKNIKKVVRMGTIPITTSKEQMNGFINENHLGWKNKFNHIPYMDWEVETNDEGKLTSITLIQKIKGKYYKVISQKDYGVIKSRFKIDKNGKFENYEKCDLVPYNGEMEIYTIDKSDRGYHSEHLEYSLSIKDGVLDGKSIRYYKSDDCFSEETTYKNGKKDGFYKNEKNGVEGNYVNGKKDGDWVENLNLRKMFDSETLRIKFERFYLYNLISNFNVKYVNGKLNGKFHGKDVSGYFIDGKLCGELIVDGVKINLINNLINGSIIIKQKGFHYGECVETLTFDMGEFISYVKEDDRNGKGEITYQKHHDSYLIFKKFDMGDTHRDNYHWMNKDLVEGFYTLIPKRVKDIIDECSEKFESNDYFSSERMKLVYYKIFDEKNHIVGGITNNGGEFKNRISPIRKRTDYYSFESDYIKYKSIYGFYIDNRFYVIGKDKKPIEVYENPSILGSWGERYSDGIRIDDLKSYELKQRLNDLQEQFEKQIQWKEMRKNSKQLEENLIENEKTFGGFESFPMD